MTKVLVTCAAFLLLSVAAHAADAPPPEAPLQTVPVAASAPAAAPALICHQESQTGSTIIHKVCRTKEQVADDQRATEEAKRQIGYEGSIAAQQHLKNIATGGH